MREIELALPAELTREQNISLVLEYIKEHFVNAGMCADICVHDTGGGNTHSAGYGDIKRNGGGIVCPAALLVI